MKRKRLKKLFEENFYYDLSLEKVQPLPSLKYQSPEDIELMRKNREFFFKALRFGDIKLQKI